MLGSVCLGGLFAALLSPPCVLALHSALRAAGVPGCLSPWACCPRMRPQLVVQI